MSGLQVIQFKPEGSEIVIKVHVGYANYGEYWFYLYDKNGKNPQLIGSGITHDEIPDQIEIIEPRSINNRVFYWQVRTIKTERTQPSKYYVSIQVEQDGMTLYEDEWEDNFSNFVEEFAGMLKFQN
ncbi:hypothetical protein D0814_25170 [Vibrio parahaemolyticus]|nr:hypothetical protein [Vibrio parahaemolyticus]EHH1260752.1 hypothetical protein [Vibrio parahaemolyticus]